MHHRLALSLALLSSPLLAGACGGEQEQPTTPPPPALKPWHADELSGPFTDVAAFCEKLGAPTCEAREDAAAALGTAREQKTAPDGTYVKLFTVVSSDDKTRRTHLLLARAASATPQSVQLFALPPAAEHDPKDAGHHEITIRSLEADEKSGLVILVFAHDTTSGEGPTKKRESHARHAFCRVNMDFPVACALFDAEHIVTTGDDLKEAPEQSAEVLITVRERGRVTLTAHGQSGEEGLKLLSPPGDYQIAFP